MNEDISHIIDLFKPRRVEGRPIYKMERFNYNNIVTSTIKICWNAELAKTLINYNSIDAEVELSTTLLKKEISKYKYL